MVAKEANWKAAIAAASTKQAREDAQDQYKHPQIKAAIVVMFDGKCAYCESRIRHIEYGHIEHFKPKSLPQFFELAVDWDNLLLACGICNGVEYKGAKFPGANEGGPLVNPTAEDPSAHLKFEFDPAIGLASVLGITERGKTSIKILGLDRHDLVKHRSGFVKKLVVISKMYVGDAEARAIIDASVAKDEEYRAFAIPIRQAVVGP